MVSSSKTSLSTATTVASVATVAVISIASVFLLKRYRQSDATCTQQDEVEVYHQEPLLTQVEGGLYRRDEPAISTLTWFQGDYVKASVILQRRVNLILQKNPWLTGRVVKKRGRLLLEYPNTYPPKQQQRESFFFMIDPTESTFSRNTPVDELGKLAEKFVVRNGPNEPLFRVTIVPSHHTNPQDKFALVVSMSHVVGDGATFYKIHNMLCSIKENSIVELIPQRIPTTQALQAQAIGQEEYDYAGSIGILTNVVFGFLRVKMFGPPEQHAFVILDRSKIQHAKQESAAQEDLPFVSTNDVLTSWFLQQTGCNMGLMAINFRNRLEGHSDLHAGNYEYVLIYQREDSKTPGLIRKSLANLKRTVTPNDALPGFWETLKCNYAIVSNWASFAQPNILQGCTEELHIPLYDIQGKLPYSLVNLIIFRAGPNKLALYMGGQDKLLQGVRSAPFFSAEALE